MTSERGEPNNSSYTDTKRFQVEPVRNDNDLQAVVTLFYEYVAWLDLDLAFQGFDAEMQAMPGKYAPPTGKLLLARNAEGSAVGCVALRPQGQDICEMKRLWVRDIAKGSGLGKELVKAIIKAGQDLGYQRMRLDTLPRMKAAVSMYRSFGFVEIPAYYQTPLEGTHFLELDLTKC